MVPDRPDEEPEDEAPLDEADPELLAPPEEIDPRLMMPREEAPDEEKPPPWIYLVSRSLKDMEFMLRLSILIFLMLMSGEEG